MPTLLLLARYITARLHLATISCIAIAFVFTLFTSKTAQTFAQEKKFKELVDAQRDIVYVKRQKPDWTGKLDLYRLKEKVKEDKPMPVIVWVHGGGWRAGSKNRCPALYLVPKGYAVVSVSYRLSQVAKFPAPIHDCKAAIRFLRANSKKYNLDPKRIGVWGASAGGHLVSLLGTTADVKALNADPNKPTYPDRSSAVNCVINFFGPTDFDALIQGKARNDPANPVAQLLGGTVAKKIKLAQHASPIYHVTKDDAPHLFMHGDRDSLVPLKQSELLHAALEKVGVKTSLYVVKGKGHGFGGADIVRRVTAFFDEHLMQD